MSNRCAKKNFLLNQSNFETSFLTLKCARCLDLKCLSDNHDKIYKFFETYELDWMKRFNARRLNIKLPGKKCIHAQLSVHSFYEMLMVRHVALQFSQPMKYAVNT